MLYGRHKDNMTISETKYVASTLLSGEAKPVTQTTYINVKAMLEHRKFCLVTIGMVHLPSRG